MKSIPFAYYSISAIELNRARGVPLFQRNPNCVVNRVEYRDGLLIAEISLRVDVSK